MDQTQPSRPRRARPRWAALVGLVALVAAALAGCSTISVLGDLTETLQDAGFTDVRVDLSGSDPVVLVVRASAPAGDTTDEGHDRAAELVWTRFPRRVEQLRTTIDGDRRDHTATELRQAYGPRPAGLDETDLADELTRASVVLVLGVLVGGLLLVLGAGVVALLLVRSRRRTAPRPAPWAPPGGDGTTPWATGPPGGPGPPPALPGVDAPPAPAPAPRPAGGPRPAPVGRAPRGPVPPPSQTPPGWER